MVYDTIILGAGAAGMASSIYLSRYRLSHLIFGEIPGGQFLDAVTVENYPGFQSIAGTELVAAFKEHVESYGVKIRPERVGEIQKEKEGFRVKTAKGEIFQAKTVILALGARHRTLNIPGEDQFLGKGVSYCAACDAPLFKGKDVMVAGGGDSAVDAAIHLASFARQVYLVARRELNAAPAGVEKLKDFKNVTVILNNTVKEIQGKERVEQVIFHNPVEGKAELKVSGVFVEVGLVPASSLAKALGVKLGEEGHLLINPAMETNVRGVFGAGDLALVPGALPFRQIITSVGDGAKAAAAVFKYLKDQEPVPDWG
ncbi:MAG: FAD-dependent oxidoreductase [Patescibacteria group bacterium]